MRFVKAIMPAAFISLANDCANPNTWSKPLLRTEHSNQPLNPKTSAGTPANQALFAANDEHSLLAQYLLYRF